MIGDWDGIGNQELGLGIGDWGMGLEIGCDFWF